MKYLSPIALLFLFSCSHPIITTDYILTKTERRLCDSLQIDSSVVIELRKHTQAPVEAFHYSLSKKILANGTEEEIDPFRLPGLVLDEPNASSAMLVNDCSDLFRQKGYTIFMLENNFGYEKQPDRIAILKETDQHVILKMIKTDGINYDIDTDSLVKIIRHFEAVCTLQLIGASGDYCEFKITVPPKNWDAFAKDVYKYCPDIVDQGTGDVEALEKELVLTKKLYLWWD